MRDRHVFISTIQFSRQISCICAQTPFRQEEEVSTCQGQLQNKGDDASNGVITVSKADPWCFPFNHNAMTETEGILTKHSLQSA